MHLHEFQTLDFLSEKNQANEEYLLWFASQRYARNLLTRVAISSGGGTLKKWELVGDS